VASFGISGTALKFLGALGVYLVLALVKTYPLGLHLGTHLAEPGDPYHITWILAWDTHALATNPLGLFNANMFYPVERSLAFSEHLLGVLPIYAPVYLLTGNPTAAYNVLFILTFALSGFAMFCLAYYWTEAFWAALVAGGLFGFAPFRFGQHGHLHLLCLFWAPLALLFLDLFLRTVRWRHLAGFAVFFWLQILSSLTLASMTVVAVVLYASYYAIVADRALLSVSLIGRVGVFVGASLALLVPLHVPYLEVRRAWGFARSLSEVLLYAPDILNYLSAPPFMNDLYLAVFQPVSAEPAPEKWLFPGLVLPALALLGSRGTVERVPPARARVLRQVCWVILCAGLLISLGPYLIAFGRTTRIPLPYLLLYDWVPAFAGMRVPGRFALLAVLAASPLAALGVARCSEAVSRRWGCLGRARRSEPFVALAFLGLAFLELGWKPLPAVRVPTGDAVPEVYRWLAATRPGPIVELPFGVDLQYVYLSTVHWLPVVNGLSSYFPPSYVEIRQGLTMLPASAGIEYASALGIKAIVVHTAALAPEDARRWIAAGEAGGGLTRLATFGSDVVYSLPTTGLSSSLTGEVSAPDWLPARRRLTLGLLLRPDGRLPWRHRQPYWESDVEIQWSDPRTGRSFDERAQVRLPVVVSPGQTVAIPLALSSPDLPAEYTLRVSMPSAGVTIEPRSVAVRNADIPTSRDAAPFLAAAYIHRHGSGPVIGSPSEPVLLDITAVNTGGALWLAQAEGDRGAVRLGWRWLKDGPELARSAGNAPIHELQDLAGRASIPYDVFPGQQARFVVSIPSPQRSGRYTLELGLVSELVTPFADVGTPPVRLAVEVRADADIEFARLVERLRLSGPNGPRLTLSADGVPHRAGERIQLTIELRESRRPWIVDAYLVLETPLGAISFYNGERLVAFHRKQWTLLGGSVRLPVGKQPPLVLSVPLPGLEPGTYTWYLVVTERGGHRILADARTRMEIVP
jgi:hypothetical protein